MKAMHIGLYRKVVGVAALWLMAAAGLGNAWAQSTLFTTGFEPNDGYSTELDLVGQDGWIGNGSSGVVTNQIQGFGQQAYIGYAVPAGSTNDFYSAYPPINFDPAPTSQYLVKFSVVMQIVNSTSTNWDAFRWSVYNIAGQRLFSLDFDNASLLVSYLLDDGKDFVSANTKFDNLGYYDLSISMNLARNYWSATLNDQVIINAQPITTAGSALTLGDIDAVWVLQDPLRPGDNFMLFDNYTVTAEPAGSIAPRFESLEMRPGGAYHALFYGEPGLLYQIEKSSDLLHWDAILRFTAPTNGVLDFQDPPDPNVTRRFYRARQAKQP